MAEGGPAAHSDTHAHRHVSLKEHAAFLSEAQPPRRPIKTIGDRQPGCKHMRQCRLKQLNDRWHMLSVVSGSEAIRSLS